MEAHASSGGDGGGEAGHGRRLSLSGAVIGAAALTVRALRSACPFDKREAGLLPAASAAAGLLKHAGNHPLVLQKHSILIKIHSFHKNIVRTSTNRA